MKKRLSISILVSLALIFCLSACNKVIEIQPGVPTGSFAPTPSSTPSGTPSSDAAGDSAALTEAVTDMAKEDLLPAVAPSQPIDPELAKEYAEQYASEKSVPEVFMEVYPELVDVKVESSDKTTATVTFTAPDLPALLTEAVKTVGDEVTSDALQQAMTDLLLSGNYPTRSQTCTLALTLDKNGDPVLEKSAEYWDAVYGGLFSLMDDLLAQMEGTV